MKKYFKNIVTGNILAAKNADAAALMEKSDRYVAVAAPAPKAPAARKATKKSK